eukprot:3190252-Pyramimonas_sp.AAC.1
MAGRLGLCGRELRLYAFSVHPSVQGCRIEPSSRNPTLLLNYLMRIPWRSGFHNKMAVECTLVRRALESSQARASKYARQNT